MIRDYYEEQVKEKISYIKINGDTDQRLPGTSNISFRFIEGEGLLLNLDINRKTGEFTEEEIKKKCNLKEHHCEHCG